MRPDRYMVAAVVWMGAMAQAPVHAYLDPGSGSALLYIFAAIVGAVGFAAKSVYYRLRGRGAPPSAGVEGGVVAMPAVGGDVGTIPPDALVLFSEGRSYALTFRPLVEALLAGGHPFRYRTLDVRDPILTLDHPLLDARYVGKGSLGLMRIGRTRARLMLATTPNIGTPGYPLPRPRGVECLAHVFHSHGVTTLSKYRRHALDAYDAVLMPSSGVEWEALKLLEKKRGLSPKEYVAVGLPYMDVLARRRAERAATETTDPKCVLVAPTWGEAGDLALCGEVIVPRLLEAGYTVIFRPHSHSRVYEPGLLASVLARFANDPRVAVDEDVDASASMERAAVLISDTSGVRYDFAFLYEKPVVSIRKPMPKGFESDDLGEADRTWWMAERAGAVIDATDASTGIVAAVARAGTLSTTELGRLREESMVNFGHASEAVVAWLAEHLTRKANPDAA